MRISIIIPCFKAIETLERAVSSIMAQTIFSQHSRHMPEIILAADDHDNYAGINTICKNVKIVPPVKGRIATGPGATRNRGIHVSSGDFLGFLDADDEWSEEYLEELLPLARLHGAAFAPTAVFNHGGDHLITLGHRQNVLRPSDFGHWPGSFHPLVHRRLTHGFTDGAGQDVFHALDVLGLVGGQAPMAKTALYKLHLKDSSVTADPGFSRNIARRYRAHIHAYRKGHTSLFGMARIQAMQALYRRQWWNHAWLDAGSGKDGFYGFVAGRKII